MRTISIKATEPQAEFHALTCKYALFVGGYGSGKSETMCNQALVDASYDPKAVVALYAPTYDLLKLITIPRLLSKLEEFNIRFSLNKVDNIIIIQESGFGKLILRSLDRPERIVGYESFRAHIDELDTLPMVKASDAWNKIIARNRQVLRDNPDNRVCVYTTPEGFMFAYDRWVRNSNELYGRVHASSYSNPFLPEGYIDALRATYPAELAEAYIEGKFVNLSGGNVYSSYNRKAHRSTETIRPGETLYIGCDFNVTKQAATVFVKREGGQQWHAVAEWTDMYDTPEMIRIFEKHYSKHALVIYPDATGGSRKSVDASVSDIALLQQARYEVRVNNSNPKVKDRIIATNVAFSKGRLYINDVACPTVASALEQQAYDKNGEPDKKSGVDHQNDATTYPIAYEMPIRKPVAQINFGYAVR